MTTLDTTATRLPAPDTATWPTASPTAVAGLAPAPAVPAGLPSEASLLPRAVALLTPLLAIAAGALAHWVASHTGAHLDTAGITAFMVTASTTVLAAAWKWLQGWQQHELLVAHGLDVPRRPGAPVPAAPTPAT